MTYNLPEDYVARSQPKYFDDVLPDSEAWQSDVYRAGVMLARKAKVSRLIDLGCGNGKKLLSCANEFKLTGVDFGSNIDKLIQSHPEHDWLIADLNCSVAPSEIFEDSVVIVADIIEHLPDPMALIQTIRNACETAAYVLVSTPDRDRIYNYVKRSPPGNPSHCREWTLSELEGWFKSERLPVQWAGWTISNETRPDQVNTSLLILSKQKTEISLGFTYQPAMHWRKKVKGNSSSNLKVWMTPTPTEAGRDPQNAIHQIVLRLDNLLPNYGIELVEQPDNADLKVAHAGQGSASPVDVTMYHGLYNTAGGHNANHFFAINSHVIRNLRTAKIVTAPSEWIADVLRRDMHLSPDIVPWGVDVDEWTPVSDPGLYCLWNKARTDAISDPAPMLALAELVPDMPFLTTFGDGGQNVRTIGRQPYEVMKNYVRNASVYLATVTETFGIATVEAMAAGVPVLGFRHGNTAQIVTHGVTGFLAEPGDIEGLREGLIYCMKHRSRLGANAREAAKAYTWDRVAQSMAAIYRRALEPHLGVKVSVVIPCHNYAEYVGETVKSVLIQSTSFQFEVIVVLDRCTDASGAVARSVYNEFGYLNPNAVFKVIQADNGSLSATRNDGIKAATGEYIVCLDADDRLGSPLFLQTLSDALDADRTLGIAFTSIRFMNAAGELGHLSDWPKGYSFDAQAARRNQIPSCCMFRKEAWQRAGGFRPWFKYAEDAEFWTTVLGIGYGAKHVVEDGWFQYRLHNKSASQVHRTGEVKEPDWTEFHPWTKDGEMPLAAGGKPPLGSWPVRFYLKPDVTVIIPVGEGHEELVKDALHSVEGQTHRYWECIVVDDTGGFKLDLTGFPWARVYPTLGNIGAGYARNLGASKANSPFIVFLDADDILKPRFLELALKTYRTRGKYAYCDWMEDDRRGNVTVHPTPEYSLQQFWETPSLHPVTALIPRKWFNDVGGFDESLDAFEDVDLFMKFLTRGYCGARIAEPLLVYNLDAGKRRKAGEKKRPQFLALLKQRYGKFMEGKTVCDCTEPPKGKAAVPPTPENAADYAEAYGAMVKVQYVYQFAPESPVTLKLQTGTRVNYGQRAKGDIFYIWEADLNENEGMFAKVIEYEVEPVPTVVPPAPIESLNDLHADANDSFHYPVSEPDDEGDESWREIKEKKTPAPRGVRKAKASRRKTS